MGWTKQQAAPLAVGICLLLLLAAAAIGTWALYDWSNPFNDARFEPGGWTGAASDEARAPMADDLVDNHLRKGMTRAEVVSLLGAPMVLTGDCDSGGNALPGSETLSYSLGSWCEFGYDDAYLYVHLDAAGRVMEAEVTGY